VIDDYHDLRLERLVPTVRELLAYGAQRIVLMGHRGRPAGHDDLLGMEPVRDHFEALLHMDGIHESVVLVQDIDENPAHYEKSRILMLENLRFWPQEKKGSDAFAQRLIKWGSIYVNDSFGNSHRSDTSISFMPSVAESAFAGPELAREVSELSSLFETIEHPFVLILGGAKISTKLPLIQHMVSRADSIVLGGGIANTVLAAEGYEVGKSLVEFDMIEEAKKLVSTKIVLPKDAVMQDGTVKKVDELNADDAIMDIGPSSGKELDRILVGAKTILWNGPLGKFEDERFARRTYELAQNIARHLVAKTVAGGGETVETLERLGIIEDIDFVSTGGGAMLALLSGEDLPGLSALQ